MSILLENGESLPRLARLDVGRIEEEINCKGKQRMDEYPTICLSPSILRRPSINSTSTYSTQDRLSVGSSTGETRSISPSRRNSRVRFSEIELSPPASTAMLRRGSAEGPPRVEAYLQRIRPASLPVPPSTIYPVNTDFAPKLLPTPQRSPTRPTRSPSLRPRSSIDGLRADLDTHRLSASMGSRRNSRSSVAGPSRRNSARFSILVEPEDLALLAEAEARIDAAFAPLPLRYPSVSKPHSMFIPSDKTASPSSSRPLSLPGPLTLPPLPASANSSPTPHSLPLPLSPLPSPQPTSSLPDLAPRSAVTSAASRTLSPIQDDDVDVMDAPVSTQAIPEAREEERSDPCHDFMSGALLEPTGRKREQTDSSILSLTGVAHFPVPPPRIASSDSIIPMVQATFNDDSLKLENPESETLPMMDAISQEKLDLEETTDTEAIVTKPCLGSSPDLIDLVEQLRARRNEDGDAESEIDLHMPITEAAIACGIISAQSRLLRPERRISSLGLPRSAAPPKVEMTRSASYNGQIYPSSDSEDEAFAREVRAVRMRKLAKSTYLRRKQEQETELAESRARLGLGSGIPTSTPSKRFSSISTSSCSSTDLVTPDTRRHTFHNDRSPFVLASPSKATRIPVSKRYSITVKPGRTLPQPTRQVKGWGPPEIMIYEESDDEPIALSSSDDEESCMPSRSGSFKMSVGCHRGFEEAKKRLSTASQRSTRQNARLSSENDWLMDEELPGGGDLSDLDQEDRLRVPGTSIIGNGRGSPF